MPYAPRATFDNPYGPQVTFRTEDVLPPAAYYISPEDRVTVWLMTGTLTQTIYLQMRLLMPTGEIKLIPYQFAPQSTFSWNVAFEVPPWEGYLVGAMCWSDNPQRGQCFISVQLMRSAPPSLTVAGIVLMQGYTNTLNVLSYPTSTLESTFSGRGAFLTITKPSQTGSQVILQVPPNTLWKLYSFTFTLSTSAAAGNRLAAVTQFDTSSNQLGVWPAGFTQSASTLYVYTFAPGQVNNASGPYATIGAPSDISVPAQTSLQTFVENLDAGDQFINIAAVVEQWVGV